MPLTPKKMLSLLKKNGYSIISQNGSHIKLRNKETEHQIILPYHNKELKKGIEQAILKAAGIRR